MLTRRIVAQINELALKNMGCPACRNPVGSISLCPICALKGIHNKFGCLPQNMTSIWVKLENPLCRTEGCLQEQRDTKVSFEQIIERLDTEADESNA